MLWHKIKKISVVNKNSVPLSFLNANGRVVTDTKSIANALDKESRRTWLYRTEADVCRFQPELKPYKACFEPYKVHHRKTWYSFKLSVNQYFVLVHFASVEPILQICHILLAIGERKRELKSLNPF
ncbi:unnamed protein product [Larinioides sclopetarius]|uniref:LAGLIDADG homing endonuclease n=1 Tax=Larinioides sclopetarius TaxID=280406 RepID=A0AAV2A4Z8_9ARAC